MPLMTLPTEFQAELFKLPGLAPVGTALAEFAAKIGGLDTYEKDGTGRWVARPGNFVTFKV